MATNGRWDEADLDSALAWLGGQDTSRERAGQIRARALRSLAARAAAPRLSHALAWRRLEPVAAIAVGAAYLAVIFRMAAALYG